MLFFRKEREFYAKYYKYKSDIDDVIDCLELRYEAKLPSDVDFVDKKYNEITQRIKRKFLVGKRVRDWMTKVFW